MNWRTRNYDKLRGSHSRTIIRTKLLKWVVIFKSTDVLSTCHKLLWEHSILLNLKLIQAFPAVGCFSEWQINWLIIAQMKVPTLYNKCSFSDVYQGMSVTCHTIHSFGGYTTRNPKVMFYLVHPFQPQPIWVDKVDVSQWNTTAGNRNYLSYFQPKSWSTKPSEIFIF